MLVDQDHPLEDAIAETEAKPDPAVVVVYRTRGVPWLLVPPLLLLAGVAAIVVYRRSEEVSAHAAALAWRDASSHRATVAVAGGSSTTREANPTAPETRSRVDALDELTSATGRPATAPAAQDGGSSYDPTPPTDEPASPKPAPSAAPPAAEPARAPEKPKVDETKPVAPAPQPAEPKPTTAAVTPAAPAVVAPSEPTAGAKPLADPFDPLVVAPQPAKPVPVEPPAAAGPTARRDRVGFDPQATPATLEAEAEPRPEPDQPAADRAAVPEVPPAGEQPFELDRRKPAGAGDRAAARRAEQTREAELDEQAEAERRLAERAHLEEIKNDFLNPDPVEYRRRREALKAAARRVAAEDRQPFHEELKRLIREQGRAAGPDIKALRQRFGVDTVPEVYIPAARDLIQVASRMTNAERVRRMRQWGLPETMIIDDLYEQHVRNIGGRGGARNEDEAWFLAAWTLLYYPPGTPRANPQPAAPAPR
ncbi:MAG TPA: hypothetical protein VGH33_14105 [Isosphaeraceae bacterium]